MAGVKLISVTCFIESSKQILTFEHVTNTNYRSMFALFYCLGPESRITYKAFQFQSVQLQTLNSHTHPLLPDCWAYLKTPNAACRWHTCCLLSPFNMKLAISHHRICFVKLVATDRSSEVLKVSQFQAGFRARHELMLQELCFSFLLSLLTNVPNTTPEMLKASAGVMRHPPSPLLLIFSVWAGH